MPSPYSNTPPFLVGNADKWERFVRWTNVGIFLHGFGRWGIMTPWGNVVVCPWEERLFSYRYGYRKCWHIAGACVAWVWLRRLKDGAA